jgi:hypothetical protein
MILQIQCSSITVILRARSLRNGLLSKKTGAKQWANYIASGGERPPKAPPHA